MRRRLRWSLVVAAAALGLPQAARAEGIWFGKDITQNMPAADKTNLNDMLQRLAAPPAANGSVGPWVGSFAICPPGSTGPGCFGNNPEAARGVTIPADPTRVWPGFTILSSLGGIVDPTTQPPTLYGAILIDMQGNVVNKWPAFGTAAKILPGGNLLGGTPGRGPPPAGGALVQWDWCGNVVNTWTLAQHHDFEREGSPTGYYAPWLTPITYGGKTLILANDNPDPTLTQHISKFPLYDDSLYEYAWDGTKLWEWHAWEHVEQMGFSPVARKAMQDIRVFGGPAALTDWTHANQAAYLGPNRWYAAGDNTFNPENIIMDFRSMNLIIIIARKADPMRGVKEGDIVWRVGPDYDYTKPWAGLGQIIGQHTAHMIPRGLPGEGNILVFDNGGYSGWGTFLEGLDPFWPTTFRNYSRVLEFNPNTFKIVWEYKNTAKPEGGALGAEKPNQRKFFSTLISSAQRLKNGNTLIAEGGDGRVFEVTKSGEIVWEYISPFADFTFPGGGGTIGGNGVYRAYRVPAEWLPPKANRTCPVN